MTAYRDVIELARICRNQAKFASSEEAAAKLRQMADKYLQRAAELNNGVVPEIDAE